MFEGEHVLHSLLVMYRFDNITPLYEVNLNFVHVGTKSNSKNFNSIEIRYISVYMYVSEIFETVISSHRCSMLYSFLKEVFGVLG